MIIGARNKVKGDIKFDGILRIDGTIDGRMIAPLDVSDFSFCKRAHFIHLGF
jgi:cytoskeletal protein CcmA (bactofilin family)